MTARIPLPEIEEDYALMLRVRDEEAMAPELDCCTYCWGIGSLTWQDGEPDCPYCRGTGEISP
jgi:hypothetical protein